jgi:hypothetical protein
MPTTEVYKHADFTVHLRNINSYDNSNYDNTVGLYGPLSNKDNI